MHVCKCNLRNLKIGDCLNQTLIRVKFQWSFVKLTKIKAAHKICMRLFYTDFFCGGFLKPGRARRPAWQRVSSRVLRKQRGAVGCQLLLDR